MKNLWSQIVVCIVCCFSLMQSGRAEDLNLNSSTSSPFVKLSPGLSALICYSVQTSNMREAIPAINAELLDEKNSFYFSFSEFKDNGNMQRSNGKIIQIERPYTIRFLPIENYQTDVRSVPSLLVCAELTKK